MHRKISTAIVSVALMAVFAASANAAGPGGWSNVGGGLNDNVTALNTDSGALLASGRFFNAGGVATADKIARWNGSSWSGLGSLNSLGVDGAFPSDATQVDAIAYDSVHNKIYAGGTFVNANGNTAADYLVVFDGVSWQPACGSFNAKVSALKIIGGSLYVGGAFTNYGADITADGLVRCDLTTGVATSVFAHDGDLVGGVLALASDSNGVLYAAIQSIDIAGIPEADYVARYNGATWSSLGVGFGGAGTSAIDTVNADAVATQGTNVYVGTDDLDIQGDPLADHVGLFDGSATWTHLGHNTAGSNGYFPGPTTEIYGLLPVGATLYATGIFHDADANPVADGVAAFENGAWHPLGNDGFGLNQGPLGDNGSGRGFALASYQGSLIVGGNFVNAGGDAGGNRIASFPLPQTPVTPPLTPTAAQGTPLPPGLTGQRAAALKKCKKKKGAARKKCRKKAQGLPE